MIEGGVDIWHGHHLYAVQGIEPHRHGLILYSVGNLLLRGARNMGSLNVDMDYGALVRIGYDTSSKQLASIELVLVYDMCRVVVSLEPDAARLRIARVNLRS